MQLWKTIHSGPPPPLSLYLSLRVLFENSSWLQCRLQMRQKWSLICLALSASPLHSPEYSHLLPRSILANKQTRSRIHKALHLHSRITWLCSLIRPVIASLSECSSHHIACSKYLLNQTLRSLWHIATQRVSLNWQSRGVGGVVSLNYTACLAAICGH